MSRNLGFSYHFYTNQFQNLITISGSLIICTLYNDTSISEKFSSSWFRHFIIILQLAKGDIRIVEDTLQNEIFNICIRHFISIVLFKETINNYIISEHREVWWTWLWIFWISLCSIFMAQNETIIHVHSSQFGKLFILHLIRSVTSKISQSFEPLQTF